MREYSVVFRFLFSASWDLRCWRTNRAQIYPQSEAGEQNAPGFLFVPCSGRSVDAAEVDPSNWSSEQADFARSPCNAGT